MKCNNNDRSQKNSSHILPPNWNALLQIKKIVQKFRVLLESFSLFILNRIWQHFCLFKQNIVMKKYKNNRWQQNKASLREKWSSTGTAKPMFQLIGRFICRRYKRRNGLSGPDLSGLHYNSLLMATKDLVFYFFWGRVGEELYEKELLVR